MEIRNKVFILFGIVFSCVCCQTNSTDYKKEINLGKRYYFEHKYDSALYCLNSLPLHHKYKGENYYYLSKVYLAIENYSESNRNLTLAYSNNYNIDTLNELHLDILSKDQNYILYDKICDSLIMAYPAKYKFIVHRAKTFYNRANHSEPHSIEANEYLKQALEDINKAIIFNNKDNYSYFIRGTIRLSLEDFKGALSDLDIYFANIKNDSIQMSKVYRFKGLICLKSVECDKSQFYFDTAIIMDPKEISNYLARGEFRFSKGNLELACEDFRKSLELGDTESIEFIRKHCK